MVCRKREAVIPVLWGRIHPSIRSCLKGISRGVSLPMSHLQEHVSVRIMCLTADFTTNNSLKGELRFRH